MAQSEPTKTSRISLWSLKMVPLRLAWIGAALGMVSLATRTARSKHAEETGLELEADGIQIESAGRRVVVALVTPKLLPSDLQF